VKKYYPVFIIVFALWLFGSCDSAPDDTVTTPSDPPVASVAPALPNPNDDASTPQESQSPSVISTPVPNEEDSRAVLVAQTLVERGRSASTNYSRDAFGSAWKDVDRNGCDTRNDILARDFSTVIFKAGTNECKVVGGTWTDPYSNETYTFTEPPSGAQIDHVVALKNAWEMGADMWTDEKRTEFANDPLNLVVTVASLNAQKSDSNAASWLPPFKPGRCEFIARVVAVKFKWQLFVTSAEKAAMLNILSKPECAQTSLPN